MIAVRLPPRVQRRLEGLGRKTGWGKTFYVREAILRHPERPRGLLSGRVTAKEEPP